MIKVNRRLLLALVAALVVATPATPAFACPAGYYQNSKGKCVERPRRANRPPAGATAKCRDGTYSFSQSRRGTCSHHGGVAQWL